MGCQSHARCLIGRAWVPICRDYNEGLNCALLVGDVIDISRLIQLLSAKDTIRLMHTLNTKFKQIVERIGGNMKVNFATCQ